MRLKEVKYMSSNTVQGWSNFNIFKNYCYIENHFKPQNWCRALQICFPFSPTHSPTYLLTSSIRLPRASSLMCHLEQLSSLNNTLPAFPFLKKIHSRDVVSWSHQKWQAYSFHSIINQFHEMGEGWEYKRILEAVKTKDNRQRSSCCCYCCHPCSLLRLMAGHKPQSPNEALQPDSYCHGCWL